MAAVPVLRASKLADGVASGRLGDLYHHKEEKRDGDEQSYAHGKHHVSREQAGHDGQQGQLGEEEGGAVDETECVDPLSE